MRRALLLVFPILAVQTAHADDLDNHIRAYMERRHIPGLALAIVKDGKIVRQGAYGLANVEWNQKTTKDSVFEIGSVSKHMTNMALLQLMEEGKLSLDDPISKYVDNLPSDWQPATIDQLIHHTSGIPDMEEIAGYGMYRKEHTLEDIIKIASSKPMDFKPGEGWHYSNTAYYLLGVVLEKITGKPYAQVMKERLFDPVGLKNTGESDPWRIIPHRAQGYEYKQSLENRDAMQPSACKGAGTIVSNLSDLAAWLNVLDERKLLKPSTWDLVYRPAKLKNGTEVPYGKGWFLSPYRGLKSYEHSGGTAGYSCDIRRFPDHKLSIIVLTNLYATGVDSVVLRAADKYIPGLSYVSLKPAPDPDPKVRTHFLSAVADLTSGKPQSPYMTEKLWAGYSEGSKTTWKDRLAKMKSLQFLKKSKIDRNSQFGEKLVSEYVYRMTLTDGSVFYIVLGLTPEGKIAYQSRVDE